MAFRGCTYLVLLPDSDGIHSGVPRTTHDIPQMLILTNLVCCHSHLQAAMTRCAPVPFGCNNCSLY